MLRILVCSRRAGSPVLASIWSLSFEVAGMWPSLLGMSIAL